MKRDNKGFSLIELIVVIAIMAVLVGVMAPQVIKYIESSKQSTDLQNVAAIKSAIEVAVADEAINYDVTVKVSTDKKKIEVTGGTGDALKTTLEAMGMTNTVNLKSTGWAAGNIGVYTFANFKWTAGTANLNANKPTYDITSVFK